jgi:large subunit ribosomal protein L11
LQAKGGQTDPAPPIGPALSSKGINIMDFYGSSTLVTQDKMGGSGGSSVITYYKDKSFIRSRLQQLCTACCTKIKSGSDQPSRNKVGTMGRRSYDHRNKNT